MNTMIDQTNLLRAKYTRQYAGGRGSLLAVVFVTIVSMATLALADYYFVFSAYLPFSFFTDGWYGWEIANGTYPYMNELAAEDIAYYTELGIFGLITGIVIALIGVLGYFICWLLSKKNPSALIIGTVFFGIDCLILLLSFDVSMIIDILFHAYIMYTLIAGCVAGMKLKKLPAPIEGEAVEVVPATDKFAVDPTVVAVPETVEETVPAEEVAPVESETTPEE